MIPAYLKKKIPFKSVMFVTNACYWKVWHLFKVTYSVLKRFMMCQLWVSFPSRVCRGDIKLCSKFQRTQTFQYTRSWTDNGWNVINFEKLIVSLNIFVDYQFPILDVFYWFLYNFSCKQNTNILWKKTIHCLKIQE